MSKPPFARIQVSKRLNGAQGPFQLELSLSLSAGQLIAIQGPSGAGKTSLLRMILGLLKPDRGKIQVNGSTWYDGNENLYLPPQARRVGMVFQDYSLFPHFSVWQNLRFALPEGKAVSTIDGLLEQVGLSELRDQRPKALSGGQQQRIALVRALLRDPQILLLDEPLAAQDAPLRKQLQDDILRWHRARQLCTILVSHDAREIARLADWVFYLENGRIIDSGPPEGLLGTDERGLLEGEVIRMNEAGELLVLVGNQLMRLKSEHSYPPGTLLRLKAEALSADTE